MGYKLPDGRYVDERGKVHRNYNDALAESRTRQARQQQETFLKRSLNQYSTANEDLYGQQQLKSTLGWIPGLGQAIDRRMEGFAQRKEDANAAISGHSGQLGIYQRRMGELTPSIVQGVDTGGGGGETPPAPLRLPPPITSPNTTFQNADDEYNRLKAQFGGTTGVSQLAGMTSLPTGFTPTGGKQAAGLKDYYAAQQEVGERNIGEIIGGLEYQKGSPMEKWAKANPMLAMREYNKKFPAGEATQGPSDDAIRAAISGGKFYPSEGSPSPVTNPPDFGTPANTVPGPPPQQGAGVMEAFKPGIALSAANTAGATGMPNFQTTPESQTPGKDFLSRALYSTWGQALKGTLGAMGIDYVQGIR